MSLKAQDILVVLKLATWPQEAWRFDTLAGSVGLSTSETHAAIGRLRAARLLDGSGRRPLRRNLIEMLTCGMKYFQAAQTGGQVTGVPTAFSASPLKEHFAEIDSPSCVWPYAGGTAYGYELTPLYRTVPLAALQDAQLYELLVLVDALRLHQARATRVAGELLSQRLHQLSVAWHPHLEAQKK